MRRRRAAGDSLDIGVCDQETLDYASFLGGSSDVIFIGAQPVRHLSELDLGADLVFFLDAVGDPGNVGTLCAARWPSGWRSDLLARHGRPLQPQSFARGHGGAVRRCRWSPRWRQRISGKCTAGGVGEAPRS